MGLVPGRHAELDGERRRRRRARAVQGGTLTYHLDRYAPLPGDAYQVINKIHMVEGWAFFSLVAVSGISISFF